MTESQNPGFITAGEAGLGQQFLDNGYVIVPAEDATVLTKIRAMAMSLASKHLDITEPDDAGHFLNTLHEKIGVDALNALRLAVFNGLNAEPWFRPGYFSLARRTLEILVGNELAMQRRVNLSIQLPNDSSSLLPVHADVWSGDSPFEVVLWVPLVDCRRTKSMYLMPPVRDRAFQERMKAYAEKSPEDIFAAIADDVAWMEVPFGHVLIFSQTLMHGNRVNIEPETRWTMNCRFKSVFSPYADKKLGEFFEPISIRAASRIGLDYDLPGGFDA